jgi:plasmid stability protein
MGVMTVRGLDENTIKALKEKAKQEGTSINAALVKILRKELGIEKKRHTVVYHDLDHLAGTWDKKDLAEFQKNVEDFEKIDEKMWK